jgi:hypothetical protein
METASRDQLGVKVRARERWHVPGTAIAVRKPASCAGLVRFSAVASRIE